MCVADPCQNRSSPGNGSCPRCTCIRPNSAQRASVGTALPGFSSPDWIEGALDAEKRPELARRELRAHGAELLDAHAVLPGHGAAELHAFAQHLVGEFLAAVDFGGIAGVEEDDRVQVAVARVEHVQAAQAVLLLLFGDEPQRLRDAAAGHAAVEHVVVGGKPPDRCERRLAAGPEPGALRVAARDVDPGGARGPEHLGHARDLLVHFLGRAVRLAQQHRLRVEVVAGVHERLDRARGGLVHHLQRGGNDPCGDHGGDRVAGGVDLVERGEDHARERRPREELQRDLGRDREHPLGAVDQGGQVVAGRIERARAELHDLPLDRDRADGHHVLRGEAVLEAVHAAGVLGDVAADRGGELRRRVRREVEAVGRRRFGHGDVAHAGLDDGDARDRVDAQDAVELRHRQQHARGVRRRAAREAGARAARDDRHVQLAAGHERATDLLLGFGQDHAERGLAVGGQAVALVGAGVLVDVEQAVRREECAEGVDDGALVGGVGATVDVGVAERGAVVDSVCRVGRLCVRDARSGGHAANPSTLTRRAELHSSRIALTPWYTGP